MNTKLYLSECPKMTGYYCSINPSECKTHIEIGVCYQCEFAIYKSAYNRQKKNETQKDCIHYWLIEEPDGPYSRGECKFCGATRMFSNTPVFTKHIIVNKDQLIPEDAVAERTPRQVSSHNTDLSGIWG